MEAYTRALATVAPRVLQNIVHRINIRAIAGERSPSRNLRAVLCQLFNNVYRESSIF